MVADREVALVENVTARIRRLRRAQGLTGEQLAERLGIAAQNLRRLERGQNITLRTLARVADALGFDVRVTFVRRRSRG